jgi:hypothetical protein
MTCVYKGEDETNYKTALEVVTLIVKTLLLEKRYERKPIEELNFMDVFALASYEGVWRCREILDYLLEARDDKAIVDLKALADRILNLEKECGKDVTASLRAALILIATSGAGEIMGLARDNILVQRLESQEMAIFYAQTGDIFDDLCNVIPKPLVSMFQELVDRLLAKQEGLQTPCHLYMDEFGDMAYEGVESFFNIANDAGFHLIASDSGSLFALETAMGK